MFTVHHTIFFPPKCLKPLGHRLFDELVEIHFTEEIKSEILTFT